MNAIFSKVFGRSNVKYDKQAHTWTFPSGAKVLAGHMKDDDSYQEYIGKEYIRLYYDEVNEITLRNYQMVNSRARTTDPIWQPYIGIRATCNPSPGWVRERFVDPAPKGRVVLSETIELAEGETQEWRRIFIPALLRDHPSALFRRQYELQLRSSLPPQLVEAYLNGNWYVTEGAFFAQLWDPQVHICEPFKIPRHWPRFRCGDWGYKTHGAIYWIAVSPRNTYYVYRELMFKEKDYEEVGREIREIELRENLWDRVDNRSMLSGPLDTSAWAETGTRGPSVAEGMFRMGIPWSKATKGRAAAAQQMVRRLRHRNVDGTPAIVFFETCKEAIKVIPSLPQDPDKPDEPLKGGYDHPYDAISYGLSSRYTYDNLTPPMSRADLYDDEEEEWK